MTISIRKNRKAHYNPSQFTRRLRMSSNLSPDLRKTLGIRSFPISKDNEVLVISGKYKGKTGKVLNVSRREYKVTVDNCAKVMNGKMVNELIDASNLRIMKMDLERECVKKKMCVRK